MKQYDLLITNGTVIDPAHSLHQQLDVALAGGRVAAVAPALPPSSARQVLDASGLLVLPGLIDLHTHLFAGVSFLGVEPDPNCLAKGVTTAVDAGSAGASDFAGFRRYVIDASQTRIYAFLNISALGMLTDLVGELEDLRYADADRAVAVAKEHRDRIVGIKVRLSRAFVGENGLEPLRRARAAADRLELPLMVHVGNTPAPLAEILDQLEPGDVLTHCYHGNAEGILDDQGRVLPAARHAVTRGVVMDVGHGRGSFSFAVAERALEQGFLPGTISSDLHTQNIHGPVFDLATTLSKFLHLGLTLSEVVTMATARPAAVMGWTGELGTLAKGARGDLVLMRLEEGQFRFEDTKGDVRIGHRRLAPQGIIKDGKVYAFRPSVGNRRQTS
ncbi:MAG: amidohydrolase/deacetylase family metallohydrolase [Anaerolineae bacterium]|nr:amidohydrolase/deacetylase family metallohydrolase [Anaerolineae bacterium]